MVKTAEQKSRDRYRVLLLAGKTPRTYNETNRKILEEVLATINAGKPDVQEVAEQTAETDAAHIHSASASSSGVTPAAQEETPLIQAVAPEALGFNEPEETTKQEQTTRPEETAEPENHQVAMPVLPQAFGPPVPEEPKTRAQRPLKRPRPEPDVGADCPWGDANFKRVQEAAVEHTRLVAAAYAADQAVQAERAERREQDMAERRARVLQQMDSECRRCEECVDMDYLVLGPGADLMCSKHARRHSELVLRQTDAATAGAVSLA